MNNKSDELTFCGQIQLKYYDQNNDLMLQRNEKNTITGGFDNYANILCKILNPQSPYSQPNNQWDAVNIQSGSDFLNQSGQLPLLQPIANYRLSFYNATQYKNTRTNHFTFWDGNQSTSEPIWNNNNIVNQNVFSSNLQRVTKNTIIPLYQSDDTSKKERYWAYIYKVEKGKIEQNENVIYDKINVCYQNVLYDFIKEEGVNVWNCQKNGYKIQYFQNSLICNNVVKEYNFEIDRIQYLDQKLQVYYNQKYYTFVKITITNENDEQQFEWQLNNDDQQKIYYDVENHKWLWFDGDEEQDVYSWETDNTQPYCQITNTDDQTLVFKVVSKIINFDIDGENKIKLQKQNNDIYKNDAGYCLKLNDNNWYLLDQDLNVLYKYNNDSDSEPFYCNLNNDKIVVSYQLHNGLCVDISAPKQPTFRWQIIYDFQGVSLKGGFDIYKMPKPLFPLNNGKPINRQFYGFTGVSCLNQQTNSYVFDLYPRACSIPKAIIFLFEQNNVPVREDYSSYTKYGQQAVTINKLHFFKHKQSVDSTLNIYLQQQGENQNKQIYNLPINNIKIVAENDNEYNLCYYGTLGYNDAIGCKFKRLGLSCFSNYNNYEYKVDRLVNLAYSKDSQQLLFQLNDFDQLIISNSEYTVDESIKQIYKIQDNKAQGNDRVWIGTVNSNYKIAYNQYQEQWYIYYNDNTILYKSGGDFIGDYFYDGGYRTTVSKYIRIQNDELVITPLFFKRQLKTDPRDNLQLTSKELQNSIDKVANSRIDIVYKIKIQI